MKFLWCIFFFYTQREENKDLVPVIRNYYADMWNLQFPISINIDRVVEIENRLRYIEEKIIKQSTSEIVRREDNQRFIKDCVKKVLPSGSAIYRFCARVYHLCFYGVEEGV